MLQAQLFSVFRQYSTTKIGAYLADKNIRAKMYVRQGAQWISVRFVWHDKELTLGISLPHPDYADGIYVQLKSRFGRHDLRNEVRKYSSGEIPTYGCSAAEMNAQFDRIVTDIKLYFEKYMLV